MNAEFLFFFADLESQRAFLNYERRDSLLALFRLRIHVDDSGVSHATVRDPCFRTVDYVPVAFADGLR